MYKMITSSSTRRMIVHYGLTSVVALLLITWLHIRPLCILFIVIFSYWFYKTQSNIRLVPPPELQRKFGGFFERLCSLRQDNPGMFCAKSSVCLGSLAILGHLLSGSTVVLIGLVIAAVVSTKYNFKLMKIEQNDFPVTEKSNHDADVDEFLPEENEINLFVLERASDQATISSAADDADADEDKSDEIPSELLIPDSIPEIDENSSDDDDLSIGVPVVDKVKILSAAKAKSEMEFKKGHFKKDSSISSTSSSSDEESLSKGLKFPEYSSVDGKEITSSRGQQYQQQQQHNELEQINPLIAATAQSLLASSNILPSLVSGIVQWSRGVGDNTATERMSSSAVLPSAKRLESSDESDFEILENDDFN